MLSSHQRLKDTTSAAAAAAAIDDAADAAMRC